MKALLSLLLPLALCAQSSKPRARDLGVPFEGTPGPLNAITDVTGVAVGHVTLMEGEGKLVPGKGPDPDRCHRYSPTAAWQLGSGVRGDVQPER